MHIKKLILLVIFSFIFIKGLTQTTFEKDSLKIINNATQLLTNNPKVESEDSLNNLLLKDVAITKQSKDLAQFYLARHYYITQKLEKALNITNQNIEDDYEVNFSDAKFYNLKGAIHTSRKEYDIGIRSFLKAVNAYQKQNNELREHTIYNNIANIYLALGDYEQAYHYSEKCFSKFKNRKDHPNYLGFLGILIICENNMDLMKDAKQHIDLGLSLLDSTNNIQGKVLINFSAAEWNFLNGNLHKAIPFVRKSLTISEKYRLKQFQIMSEILLMDIHNELKEYIIALNYGKNAEKKLKYFNNSSMEHAIADGLSVAYANTSQYQEAYNYLNKADSLKTIDRNEKNKRNIDSLLVQFEYLTNKNTILSQEATIAKQNSKIQQRTNLLIVGGFSLVLVVLSGVSLFIYNRQKIRLERNRREVELIKSVSETEEIERSKISCMLHDGLAAELTALKLELEMHQDISKKTFEMLNKAHQMTRRISHNLSPFMLSEKGLVEAVTYMVHNNNVNNNLHFYTNVKQVLPLKPKVETILYRSIQELVQNALKHAQATEITVQIMKNNNELVISIEDDGIGMDTSIVNNSIGLGSVKKRIELINGVFDIDSSPNQGTQIFINLKLN